MTTTFTEHIATNVVRITTYRHNDLYEKIIEIKGVISDFGTENGYTRYYPKTGLPEIQCYFHGSGKIQIMVEFHETGCKKTISHFNANEKLHAPNCNINPSRVMCRNDGSVCSKEWHADGILLRKELHSTKGEIFGVFEYQEGDLIKATSIRPKRTMTCKGNIIDIVNHDIIPVPSKPIQKVPTHTLPASIKSKLKEVPDPKSDREYLLNRKNASRQPIKIPSLSHLSDSNSSHPDEEGSLWKGKMWNLADIKKGMDSIALEDDLQIDYDMPLD